ncbi:galactosyldiacylglycerol synthase [Streptomyces sannanensis]|uniref:Galactosyldiacylglycerol synthase n=1 Tax=Streptomyces sannanensis TaxID=285536 RepID=A0ABP6SKP3_9ACTN
MERRLLIVSASMGAGHDTVAGELARRLRSRGHRVARCDVLELLPRGAGPALRESYRLTVRHFPWLYGAVYAAFFRDGPVRPGTAPLAVTAERRLLDTVAECRADAVVATFHLAAQVTGRLRASGTLTVPSAVFVTDFAAHRQWVHPGNDLHLCVTGTAAARVREHGGRSAFATGPVVPSEFRLRGREPVHWPRVLDSYAPGRTPVLVSTGAWGVASDLAATARLIADTGCLPVILCGRDDRLRLRMSKTPDVLALSWVTDLADLMGAAGALVDNAAGQTAVQALAAGLPVVGYRPIPGHGAEGVRAMAAAGVSAYAPDAGALRDRLTALVHPGPARERQITAGAAVFTSDIAQILLDSTGGQRAHP